MYSTNSFTCFSFLYMLLHKKDPFLFEMNMHLEVETKELSHLIKETHNTRFSKLKV